MSYEDLDELFKKETQIWCNAYPNYIQIIKAFSDKLKFEVNKFLTGGKK